MNKNSYFIDKKIPYVDLSIQWKEESNDLWIENESNIDDFKLDQESYKTKSSFNSENKNSEIPFSVGSSFVTFTALQKSLFQKKPIIRGYKYI